MGEKEEYMIKKIENMKKLRSKFEQREIVGKSAGTKLNQRQERPN